MMGNLGTGGDEGGDGALHVDGAAPIEEIAAYLGREGAGRPAVTGGDHIDMAGEGEMRGASPPRTEGVPERAVRSAPGGEAGDPEAEVLQPPAQYGDLAHPLRRRAGAGDDAGGGVRGTAGGCQG